MQYKKTVCIMFIMMTFILELAFECVFIGLSWTSYINNEMELLVSLPGSHGDLLYSSYYGQRSSSFISKKPKSPNLC